MQGHWTIMLEGLVPAACHTHHHHHVETGYEAQGYFHIPSLTQEKFQE